LSFRGIDNTSYYWLSKEQPRYYENFTGTGNAINLGHPRVLQMVMDSLRYWVEIGQVDGFRFDLATTLGRGPNGFDPAAAFFAAVRQDPVLAAVKLIAEPWDVGLGGYQVGHFPPGWSEWNDHFRRTLRRYWTSDGNVIGDVGGRMTASTDLLNHDGRSPRASVNHITVHDGFTLADLVSYANKHNEANREDNHDGSDDNHSTNCGVEGPTDDPEILQLRRQLRRNLLACLLLGQGVPLLLAGDEIGNSQNGNNNAYCQDNPIGWVDWSKLGHDGEDMCELIGELTALRRRFPQLRPRRFVGGRQPDGSYGVLWMTPRATEMTEQDWNFPEGRFLAYALGGLEQIKPLEQPKPPLYIVLNAAPQTIDFVFPTLPDCSRWTLELTTTAAAGRKGTVLDCGTKWPAPARSVMVFAGTP
jgi:glycogen operon protein